MKNGMADMTRKEYLDIVFEAFSLVSVLSDKNGCRVLKLKNKANGKNVILRSFSQRVPAYEQLYAVCCQNLPLVYDVIDLNDGQIVLEEFIDGVTISEVMESGYYRYIGARRVLRSVCNALNVLHGMGFVHRDVKPENVMISNDGRVVLIDFNASRKVSVADKDTVVMGTVGYASPEQLGIAQTDARTDVYAVGVLLNVMITGKHPSEKLAKGKVGRVVRRCTSVNPDERYQTAEKLSEAL